MQIDIPKQISELLYQQDAVLVPGLGGFVTSYQPAVIDHVQGTLYPPSKKVKFDANLLINDGILISAIQKSTDISYLEAEALVNGYVDDIKAAFKKKEIVSFPTIGRLYLDFEGNYKFIPDNTNYDQSTNKLPSVQYYPILRNKTVAEKSQVIEQAAASQRTYPTPPVTATSKVRYLKRFDWTKLAVPAAIGLLLITVAGSAFFMTRDNTQTAGFINTPQTVKVKESRINQSPKAEEVDDEVISYNDAENLNDEKIDTPIEDVNPTTVEDTQESYVDIEELNSYDGDVETQEVIDTESATPSPNQKVAYIVIGSFGQKKNAERAVKKLYKIGYEPYTEEINGLTRVAAQIPFESPSKVNTALRRIQRKVTERAWLVK